MYYDVFLSAELLLGFSTMVICDNDYVTMSLYSYVVILSFVSFLSLILLYMVFPDNLKLNIN